MDGFVHVVRAFDAPNVAHPAGSVDSQRDIAAMDGELLINDLIAVERKLERLVDERKKGGGRDKAVIERELALFERGFGFLTRKPILIVLNLSEGQAAPTIDYPHKNSQVVALQGKLEMDIAQLAPEDAAMFMAEYGIEELSLQRVIRLSYDLLGLMSFFTVGEDEVRAWTVRRGATAWEAAGAIHTDLQKGFIRAEVVSYPDLVSLGGLSEARSKGKLRLEGKDYILQDGEIMHVRFNI
jgi:ribosome-binding ATPase YchF (GTP1/OBG family)